MAGKPRYVESVPRPHIDCCFVGCQNSANVRVWTKTGWANVCARVNTLEVGVFHFEHIEQVPRVTRNFYLDEIRQAHAERIGRNESAPQALRDKDGQRTTSPAAADLPLGIALDAFERELGESANP